MLSLTCLFKQENSGEGVDHSFFMSHFSDSCDILFYYYFWMTNKLVDG